MISIIHTSYKALIHKSVLCHYDAHFICIFIRMFDILNCLEKKKKQNKKKQKKKRNKVKQNKQTKKSSNNPPFTRFLMFMKICYLHIYETC